jgi:hypothetical protein
MDILLFGVPKATQAEDRGRTDIDSTFGCGIIVVPLRA